ncbi:unnamed protein product [Larinioides sclopetarius]|uniref:Acyltransferase 3 domain-containing protein n=1 Tax=Larinioides sclopetarius TaxID=280406 RepID=A0AAV1ZZ49_9ARAC
MDTCLKDSCQESEWQATFPGILYNLKDKILSVSNTTTRTDQLPKTLTTEAVYMICVLVSFVTLSLVGSSITAFEYFYKANAKKNEACDVKQAKKATSSEKKTKEFGYSASDGILNKVKKILECFCFVQNGRKILARQTAKEKEISCVHGIRAINFFWAIQIHTGMLYIQSIKNLEDQGPFLRSWFIKAIMKGDLVNDAYFTLGGFLNAFHFVQDYDNNRGNISWFRFYIKRIVRVAPLYMIVLSFYTTLFPYFGSGPLWPTYSIHPVCKNVWLWNLFFVNNFRTPNNQCMIWTWYLANDFQLFTLSPLFMVPLCRWPKLGYILTVICISGSCLSNFLIAKTFNLTTDIFRIGFHLSDIRGFNERSFENFNHLLEKPYTRVSSYLIGILLGHYLSRRNIAKATRMNPVFLCCGWIFSAISMWISFFALGNAEESLLKFAVFNGMRHLLFACGISWFIFVCSTGQIELFNRFLSMHGFVVLSRLSYSAYLTHFLLLEYHFLNITELGEFSFTHVVIKSTCVFFWTFPLSFAVSAIIEMPVSRLYSILFWKQKKD